MTRERHENAKAGNINHALPRMSAPFILTLDADHVPSPGILEHLLPYMEDPKVAIVQSPQGFRNRDSLQHYDSRVHEQSLFFEVLLPGKAGEGGAFWCGSGALLRRRALDEVGGVATTSITEDLETSLAMQRAGWHIRYHNKVLVEGLAPPNLPAYLLQRFRWARGTLQLLLGRTSPIFGRGYSWSQRVSYVSNLMYYLVPVQQLIFVSVLTLALVAGLLPVFISSAWLIAVWAVQMALALLAVWTISGGRQLPFGGSRNAWITGSIYLRALIGAVFRLKATFAVTPKEGVDAGGVETLKLLWLPVAAGIVLTIATAARVIDFSFSLGLLPALPFQTALVLVFFAIAELVVLVPLILRLVLRRQIRATWRQPLHLRAQLAEHHGIVEDLHEGGALVALPDTLPSEIQETRGLLLTVWPDETHATLIDSPEPQPFHGLMTLTRPPVQENSVTYAGGRVEWLSSSDRLAALQEAYIPWK